MLLTILDGSHYQKSHNRDQNSIIQERNLQQNQNTTKLLYLGLQLEHVVGHFVCHLGLQPILKITKMVTIALSVGQSST